MANDGDILLDLDEEADLAYLIRWIEARDEVSGVTWEDVGLRGRQVRISNGQTYASPEVYRRFQRGLEEKGVNPRDREIRRGDLN